MVLTSLQTRQLAAEDAPAWRALREEGTALFPNAFLYTPEEIRALDPAQDAAMLSRGVGYGVFDGEALLGIAGLRRAAGQRSRHRGEIGPFYVRPEAQGSGAAQALMALLVAQARAAGIWQLELTVASDNPRAVRFYEGQGFARFARLPNAIITAEGPVDDWLCLRDLRPQLPELSGD